MKPMPLLCVCASPWKTCRYGNTTIPVPPHSQALNASQRTGHIHWTTQGFPSKKQK